ncbi:MAG: phosphate/phosphite/phosphonate ABC transporter substrate-binding protein [Desulfobacteraceae bacterium]|nr:phosphate/phosphite/phosphonate ABC transporter substrate-binding protein [Desulfobacteraceae bacterium]MBC2757283.1 phosphate/phosphite/phosphonate ABC transporter substrate-binding protein [Desulfobacteraceae bacterium]MBC2763925.1 phosphate/phosphite/phosphonate ABC transporter substrate-binding protein [ANME-2 cluster archaeon]
MTISARRRSGSVLAVLLFGILLCGGTCVLAKTNLWAQDKSEALLEKHTLVIGKITQNPKKLFRYLKPMVNYAAEHMKDLGITDTEVLMAKDNQRMVSYLKQGKVDWVTETPFSAIILQEKAGAEILLKKWKKGVPDYHTIFFARKDSGINSLSDLKGKTIALEDPGSTSAYSVPASILINEGLELVRLASPREKPLADKVGYVFAEQEITISTYVHKGFVSAGAFNNQDWNKDDHLPKAFRKNMIIFHKSRPFPRAIELVRKGLDPGIKQRLKEILLNAHNDPKAKKALRAYQKTEKFEELSEKDRDSLDEVRGILKSVRSELE